MPKWTLARMPSRFLAIAILVALVALACSDSDLNGGQSDAQLEPPSSPTRALPNIRDVHFNGIADIQEETGRCTLHFVALGQASDLDLAPCRILDVHYQDLTGDHREDAVIEIAGLSGMGRLPVLAVFVYGYDEATLKLLLVRYSSFGPLVTYIVNGTLAISETRFAPSEALCCPSSAELTVYEWTGTILSPELSRSVPCSSRDPRFGEIACPRP